MRTLGIRGRSFGLRTKLLAAGLAAAALAGCARAEPHVFKSAEFDRRTFAKSVGAVPGEIQVCYATRGTTPDQIARLAEEECAKYSKSAQFIRNEVIACPLATPVAARYYCCPSPEMLTIGIRCSAAGQHVDWMTREEVNQARKQAQEKSRELRRF